MRCSEIKWFYPLTGDLTKVQTLWDLVMCWRMTFVGKFVTQNAVKVMEAVGMVPKGTHDVGEALKTAADALVAGGEAKLFTPMMVRPPLPAPNADWRDSSSYAESPSRRSPSDQYCNLHSQFVIRPSALSLC